MAVTAAQLDVIIRARDEASRVLGQTGKSVGKFSGQLSSLGIAGPLAFASVGAAVTGFAAMGINELEEAARATAQTNAVLKSTGGIANVTRQDIEQLSGTLMHKAAIDDELIQSGANILLTFTKVRNEVGAGNDVFSQGVALALDMSVALGTDLKSAMLQVGKALNDPIAGITALRRAGVSFTTEQRDQIKTLVESGRLLEAQKLILQELAVEFEGSAEAAGTAGLGGQVRLLKLEMEELSADVMRPLIPILVGFVGVMQDGIVVVGLITDKVEDLGEAFDKVTQPLGWLADRVDSLPGPVKMLGGAMAAVTVGPLAAMAATTVGVAKGLDALSDAAEEAEDGTRALTQAQLVHRQALAAGIPIWQAAAAAARRLSQEEGEAAIAARQAAMAHTEHWKTPLERLREVRNALEVIKQIQLDIAVVPSLEERTARRDLALARQNIELLEQEARAQGELTAERQAYLDWLTTVQVPGLEDLLELAALNRDLVVNQIELDHALRGSQDQTSRVLNNVLSPAFDEAGNAVLNFAAGLAQVRRQSPLEFETDIEPLTLAELSARARAAQRDISEQVTHLKFPGDPGVLSLAELRDRARVAQSDISEQVTHLKYQAIPGWLSVHDLADRVAAAQREIASGQVFPLRFPSAADSLSVQALADRVAAAQREIASGQVSPLRFPSAADSLSLQDLAARVAAAQREIASDQVGQLKYPGSPEPLLLGELRDRARTAQADIRDTLEPLSFPGRPGPVWVSDLADRKNTAQADIRDKLTPLSFPGRPGPIWVSDLVDRAAVAQHDISEQVTALKFSSTITAPSYSTILSVVNQIWLLWKAAIAQFSWSITGSVSGGASAPASAAGGGGGGGARSAGGGEFHFHLHTPAVLASESQFREWVRRAMPEMWQEFRRLGAA